MLLGRGPASHLTPVWVCGAVWAPHWSVYSITQGRERAGALCAAQADVTVSSAHWFLHTATFLSLKKKTRPFFSDEHDSPPLLVTPNPRPPTDWLPGDSTTTGAGTDGVRIPRPVGLRILRRRRWRWRWRRRLVPLPARRPALPRRRRPTAAGRAVPPRHRTSPIPRRRGPSSFLLCIE
jgi:hypothetical protein